MVSAPESFTMSGRRRKAKAFPDFVSRAKTKFDVSLILFKEITLFYLNTIFPNCSSRSTILARHGKQL